MKLKSLVLLSTLSLNGFQPSLAGVDHFDMAERTYGDEPTAQTYFSLFDDVPVSENYPLWQNLSSQVEMVVMGRNAVENVNSLYAVNPADKGIYQYRFPIFEDEVAWQKVGNAGKQFVVGNGGQLYGVSTDGTAVFEYTGSGKWHRIGGATEKLYAGDGGLFRTVPGSGDIYIYKNFPNQWSYVGGPGKQFAVGGQQKQSVLSAHLYGISPHDSGLYKWSGIIGGSWTRIRNSVKEVYANGDSVFAVDSHSGDIYRYDGRPFSWTRIGGPGKQFAVVDDDLLYGISPDGNGVWRYLNGHWDRIGEAADSIYAAGEQLVAKGASSGSLWRHIGVTPEEAEYVIIVEDDAMAARMRKFVAWKEAIGYEVSVVTVEEIDSFQDGRDRAERIREYLMDVHSDQLHYVLLIGNVDVIPTRLLYPGRRRSGNLPYAADYYYADLHTTNWDADRDGRWGEFKEDLENDSNYDVVVSRIPLNDVATVERILDNTIAFEQDDGDWKFNTLQVAGFMDKDTDSAELVEVVERDFFDGRWNGPWVVDKLYIDEPAKVTSAGTYFSGEKSQYIVDPDAKQLTEDAYLAALAPQSHSLVVLSAHGSPTGMQSRSRDCNSRGCTWRHLVDFGSLNNVGLDPITGADSNSAIVVLSGCDTAPPLGVNLGANAMISEDRSLFDTVGRTTPRHNGQAYLEGGAVSVIGSSAGSDYDQNWQAPPFASVPTGDGSQTLFYYFQMYLVGRKMSVGDAFFEAQKAFADDIGLRRGIRDFYLMGDPSLTIVGYGRQ